MTAPVAADAGAGAGGLTDEERAHVLSRRIKADAYAAGYAAGLAARAVVGAGAGDDAQQAREEER